MSDRTNELLKIAFDIVRGAKQIGIHGVSSDLAKEALRFSRAQHSKRLNAIPEVQAERAQRAANSQAEHWADHLARGGHRMFLNIWDTAEIAGRAAQEIALHELGSIRADGEARGGAGIRDASLARQAENYAAENFAMLPALTKLPEFIPASVFSKMMENARVEAEAALKLGSTVFKPRISARSAGEGADAPSRQ